MTLDTVKKATNRRVTVVEGNVEDYDGTNGYFEDDQPINTTPTHTITLTTDTGAEQIEWFMLNDVRFLLDPTYTQTFRIYILEAATADNYESMSDIIWYSNTARADAAIYHYTPGGGFDTTADYTLPVIVECKTANTLYFLVDWTSGAPTSYVKGYIKIRGTLLK